MNRLKIVCMHVLVIILISTCGFAIYRHWQGDQLLSVQTGSMVPTFYPGDAVMASKIALNELKLGDIISYRNPQDNRVIISHRLIGINHRTGKLITAGDALDLQDMPLPYSLVVGKVHKVIPIIGYAIDWIHQPAGLIALLYTPAAFILVSEAKRLSRQYTKPYYQQHSYSLGIR